MAFAVNNKLCDIVYVFACLDTLPPSQQFFSHVRMLILSVVFWEIRLVIISEIPFKF